MFLLIGPLELMLADGQDLAGSYIILHVTGECSVEGGSVLYMHTHPCDYGCCPPTQYIYIYHMVIATVWVDLQCVTRHISAWCTVLLWALVWPNSIISYYDIILFAHTSAHNNTVHQALMCLVTHCRSQTAVDSQVFKDDTFMMFAICALWALHKGVLHTLIAQSSKVLYVYSWFIIMQVSSSAGARTLSPWTIMRSKGNDVSPKALK